MIALQGSLPPSATQAVAAALDALRFRGPDHVSMYGYPADAAHHQSQRVLLGHRRLSIIDTTAAAHQPLHAGGKVIVFNGEIFNYQALRQDLVAKGLSFTTESDTEVLLQLYNVYGEACLPLLNGFFAFAIYNTADHSLFIARDRYGVKPLYLWQQGAVLAFGSEFKALSAMGAPKVIDPLALRLYMQLNYLPPQHSMYQGIDKLSPGTSITIQDGHLKRQQWYTLPTGTPPVGNYTQHQQQLVALLEDAVQRRLVADVPVGVFLSGGIDSSVIAALAKRHKPDLRTFSIGFSDPVFDETRYAEAVAKHIGSEHIVFRLSFDDMTAQLESILNYIDEPFADASALNFYILSRYVRREVTVALSGDGADEIAAGYSKHVGEWQARQPTATNTVLRLMAPLLKLLPASRGSNWGRKLYQIQKYAAGLALSPAERYVYWCSVYADAHRLVKLQSEVSIMDALQPYLQPIVAAGANPTGINDVLRADVALVLAGDMLVKADMMSMANGLEVRSPFMDYRVVEFLLQLPSDEKIRGKQRKRIIQDAFRSVLPAELYHRPKQGFEVPMANWLRTALRRTIETEVLDRDRTEAEGYFHHAELLRLWQAVLSGRSGKEDLTLWAVLVFLRCVRR